VDNCPLTGTVARPKEVQKKNRPKVRRQPEAGQQQGLEHPDLYKGKTPERGRLSRGKTSREVEMAKSGFVH